MELELPRFMDFHMHLRDEPMLSQVLPYHTDLCAGGIVMPNVPPIFTKDTAKHYKSKITRIAGEGFIPLMTIQAQEHTHPVTIKNAWMSGVVAVKIYPKHGTTGSEHGLSREAILNPNRVLLDTFAEMEHLGMILQIHPELPGSFCLDREKNIIPFIRSLTWKFPKLKIVMEHVSTKEGIEFVMSCPSVAATITPQHLLYTLDDVIGPPLDPFNLCMPIYKRPEDREALVKAVTSDCSRIFAGTDSAPHTTESKTRFDLLRGGSCAGVFIPSKVALSVYASIFSEQGKLEKLPDFICYKGCKWYNIEPLKKRLECSLRTWKVNDNYNGIVPLLRGKNLIYDIEPIKE